MDGLALIDTARSGVENMAIDDAMLELAMRHERVYVRFYRWNPPTLSLGYFQKYSARLTHEPSQSLVPVRRSTGGGAIVHDHDWTYSIALPDRVAESVFQSKRHLGASQPLYDCIHDRVVLWLQEIGVTGAHKWPEATCRKSECSFLCFERRSLGDVLIGSSKVMGSAQRRQKGALLQHGSLLLNRSSYAPTLDGIAQLCSVSHSALCDQFETFCQALIGSLNDLLGFELPVVDHFEGLDSGPGTAKYSSPEWVQKR